MTVTSPIEAVAPAPFEARASSQRPETPSEASGDAWSVRGANGTALLALMGLATTVVVLVVWAVGAIGAWWVLVPAMVIHLGVTAVVVIALFRLAGDSG